MKKANFLVVSILVLMAWLASACSKGQAPTASKPEAKPVVPIEIKDRFEADQNGEVKVTGKTAPGANVVVYKSGENQGSIKLMVQPNSTAEYVVKVTKGENSSEKRFVVVCPAENRDNERRNAKAKANPQPKSVGPSRQELKAFWNRMYELNGMLVQNIEPDGFFPQVEISWIKAVRNELHSMRVPNDPQAEKYHRMFKTRMDEVWYWIFDGEDEMQAQRILDQWGYESQLLFADEYQDPND